MIRILTILIILNFTFFSCDNCELDIDPTLKKGDSFANGSSHNFDGFAVFNYGRSLDSNGDWIENKNRLNLTLSAIEDCITTQIDILNFSYLVKDTTSIPILPFSNQNDLPSAILFRAHGDALLGSFNLMEGTKSWIFIDEVNPDTTEISGQFKLSFFDEDDDNAENMLFTNGMFTAEIRSF